MNRKRLLLACIFAALLLIALAPLWLPGTQVAAEPPSPETHVAGQSTPLQYSTVLTVTSASDPDTSSSYTCYEDYTGPPAPAPDGVCTLRRAIVEAGAVDDADRPVLIKFNIPVTDTRYNGALNVWKIELDAALPYLKGGQIVIDGSTQGEIGGRTNGPRIIIEGSDLKLGEIAGYDNNEARGLALQGGGISLIGDNNIAEDNWVGLTDDGQEIYYAGDNPSTSNGATIASGGDNNLIQNNVVASARQVSIDIWGDNNVIVGNYIGTNADGTIPDVPENRKCHPDAVYFNWFTGDGMHIRGSGNRVGGPTDAERNIIAGMLFASTDPEVTPPDALEVSGENHVIQNNYIGMDVDGQELWVCGMGISIDGKYNQFLDNAIVNAGGIAFGIYGNQYSLDAITLQGNVIKNALIAITFGPNVPSAWKNFNPAKITGLEGTAVSGTSGDDSPCGNCVIELFLDDGDDQVEALQSLITTTADADGNWTVALPRELEDGEGLRTTTTTGEWDQITDFDEGTTTKISDLYPEDVTPPSPTPTSTPATPPSIPTITPMPTPAPPVTFTTVITVNSTDDPDQSPSTSCYSDPGITHPESPCTLRRAVVEASAMYMDVVSHPILIKFNIPLTDTGYDSGLDVWKIELDAALPNVKGGQVVIDGSTQDEIGGRTDGPKIIIKGSDLKLGQIAGDDNNVARGLALQEGGISLYGGDGNIVEYNWIGLTDDGQEIYYADDDPTHSNGAIIGGVSDNNLVQNNVVASAMQVSIDIQGNDNVVIGNYVGTRADGTLPDIPAGKKCRSTAPSNWWTGVGMKIGGDRNRIGGPTAEERNIIAGMLFASEGSTPPDAMNIYGDNNVVQNNYVGVDANGQEVWVCGRGISIDGRFTEIVDNTIVNTVLEAFGIYGGAYSLDAITLRGNIIKNAPTAIEFGPLVPPEWTSFNPAKVTGIDGTTVSGTSGDNSPCPYCVVELFLDDADDLVETLQSLAVVTATVDGSWTATLTAPFTSGQRIRTTSTVRDFGVIVNFEAGTTSDFSEAYVPPQTVDIIEPGQGGTIVYTDTQGSVTNIEIPPNAFGETTTVTYTAVTTPTQSYGEMLFAGRAFDLDASTALVGAITVTLSYREEDLGGVGEDSLRLYYWTGSEWDDVANTCPSEYSRDEAQNTLSVATCHLTSFGLFSAEIEYNIYMPVILKQFG